MKCIIIMLLAFQMSTVFAQQEGVGFQTLKYFKTLLESTVKEFAATIPDSTKTYRHHYILISEQYNLARAQFEGYKGSMINCINQSSSAKKIRGCLSSKSPNLGIHLDSLLGLIKRAYFEIYIERGTQYNHTETGARNVTAITPEAVNTILTSLIDAAIKISTESSKVKKQLREQFVNDISNKEYVLLEFQELIRTTSKK